jgi:hypothetical protein
MTGPHPLPKQVLHTVRSSASYFNFWYPVHFLNVTQNMHKSSSSFSHHFYPSILLYSNFNFFHTYINNMVAQPQSSTDFFVDTLLLQLITLTSCYLLGKHLLQAHIFSPGTISNHLVSANSFVATKWFMSNEKISIPCTKEQSCDTDKCENNTGSGKSLKINDIP